MELHEITNAKRGGYPFQTQSLSCAIAESW